MAKRKRRKGHNPHNIFPDYPLLNFFHGCPLRYKLNGLRRNDAAMEVCCWYKKLVKDGLE